MSDLPEEFAPKGPKLTRFAIRPAPPVRPHLFPDEARFVFRLSLLVFGTELVFWLAIGKTGWLVWLLIACRVAKPLWALLGRSVSRAGLAAGLLVIPTVLLLGLAATAILRAGDIARLGGLWLALFAASLALPAVTDLCTTSVADSITVERRAAAYSRLEMAQALGAAMGVAASRAPHLVPLFALGASLLLAWAGVAQLRDRGTPRSAWPLKAHAFAFLSPLGLRLSTTAALCTGFAWASAREGALHGAPWPVKCAMPLVGMGIAARLEPRMRNAVWLPRIAAALAFVAYVSAFQPLGLLALGMMFAALPAAVARGAGEMERPVVSSVAWSALSAGAALGAVLRF